MKNEFIDLENLLKHVLHQATLHYMKYVHLLYILMAAILKSAVILTTIT